MTIATSVRGFISIFTKSLTAYATANIGFTWVLKQDILENGEIGIFSLNGESYIKKLQDNKKGVFLISLNEKYPPIPVGENDRFDILGKVVGKNHPDEINDYLQ